MLPVSGPSVQEVPSPTTHTPEPADADIPRGRSTEVLCADRGLVKAAVAEKEMVHFEGSGAWERVFLQISVTRARREARSARESERARPGPQEYPGG